LNQIPFEEAHRIALQRYLTPRLYDHTSRNKSSYKRKIWVFRAY